MATTAAGALSRLARVNERLARAEAQAAELRAERDEALREALAFPENTYVRVNARTGLSRATITKASRRG